MAGPKKQINNNNKNKQDFDLLGANCGKANNRKGLVLARFVT